jgi:hypothetical protein
MQHLSRALAIVSSAIVVFVGCSSGGGDDTQPPAQEAPPPPRICKPPADTVPTRWFADVTADFGVVALADTIVSADLDGDGFADIVTTAAAASRGPLHDGGILDGKRLRYVLMNRPGPNGTRTFVDATDASGLLATRDGAGDRGFGTVNLGDLDGDGDVDAILCPSELGDANRKILDPCDAFMNDGKGHFTLAAPSALSSAIFWVPSGALLDYDRDGALDYWPATVAHWPYDLTLPDQPPTLFRGNGDGTFANVSKAVGLPRTDGRAEDGTEWRHVFGVTACDIDGDGDDDMIFADYGRQEAQVWRNDSGHFTNVAAALGLDHDDRQDYSDDLSYRCYCAANTGQCPASIPLPDPKAFCTVFPPNKYGRGWVPGITDQPWSLGGNYFSFACGDIDDDGDMDLMSATIVHGDVGSSADPSELIINPGNGGKFTRPGNENNGLARPTPGGISWNHGDDMAVMVDVDLDGKKDIFLTTTGAYEAADHARLWRQKPDGTFEEISEKTGFLPKDFKPDLHGPSFIDVDGDGDLDLVIGNTGDRTVKVFKNLVGQSRNFVRVRLVGQGAGASNGSAIGAVVRVTAGGRTQTQYVSGGYGHGNAEHDLTLTFGLGSACDVDAIEVRWPNATATVTRYEHVSANYTVEIHEGDPAVHYPYVDRESQPN